MINGANGEIGSRLVIQALRRGYDVIGCVRSAEAAKKMTSAGFKVLHVPEDKGKDPSFWRGLFDTHAAGRDFKFVQTVGIAYGPKVRETNVHYTEASAKAFKAVEGSMEKGRYIQLSTVATMIIPESAYGKTKEEANQILSDLDIKDTLILDVGMALPSLEEGENYYTLNTRHAFAPWQFSALPSPLRFHPIVGSGEQLVQPVDESEITTAILNFSEGQHRIAGVGRQAISSKDLMRFYADLRSVSFRPIHIPYDVAFPLSKHFSEGYFTEDNTLALHKLEKQKFLYDPKPFEDLLKARSKTLNEIYPQNNKPLLYYTPPLTDYFLNSIKILYHSCEARKETLSALKNYGSNIIKSYFKS